MTGGAHRHVVVMGVAGTGKTTVARALADTLGLVVADADDHHPPSNVAKMSAGISLQDEDRQPWLERLAAWTGERHDAGHDTVLACSALRRRYRDVLRSAVPERTVFVHLVASRAVLVERMDAREHFMPASLLDSQRETLEDLGPDETGGVVDTAHDLACVVRAAADVVRRSGQGSG